MAKVVRAGAPRLFRSFSRYFLMWGALAKNSFVRQLDYKINFVGRALTEFIWISTQIFFFRAAFQFVPQLAGWSESEIWFFVGSLFFTDGLMMVLFHDNQTRLGQLMRMGLFDYYLLYPTSSLFLSAFRFVNVISIVNLVIAAAVLSWSLWDGGNLDATHWMIWIVYTLVGAAQVGALGMLIGSMAFWTTQSTNSMWLFYELYRLAMRPENMYQTWLRRLVLSIFPAAFFVSIPVQLSLGKRDGMWFVYPWIVLAALLALLLWVWRRGLRRYEGALS